jgi:hypothetical protein
MWSMNSTRACALVAATLAGVATAASAAVPRSNLYGIVRRGPIMPVCRVGVSCDAPAARVMLTFARAGVVETTRTDEHGKYRIKLSAGIYAVHTSSKPFGQVPRPAKVHVRAGHSDQIDFAIDTGIR